MENEMAVGKAARIKVEGRYWAKLSRPAVDTYWVSLAWPTMTRNDDDDESVNCGCDFAGRAHAHMVTLHSTEEAARVQWAALKAALASASPHSVAAQLGLTRQSTNAAYAAEAR